MLTPQQRLRKFDVKVEDILTDCNIPTEEFVEYFTNNPDQLQEIIMQLRSKKIIKILNK